MSYAKDVLVDTDWVAQHLADGAVRIVEVDENPALRAARRRPMRRPTPRRPSPRSRVIARSGHTGTRSVRRSTTAPRWSTYGAPQEYSGELITAPGYGQEGAQRGGHIPGAFSVPWSKALKDDGTFRSAEELRDLYTEKGVLAGDRPVIAYCRIGERSAQTWFVLRELLGNDDVKNYDGSWTEWGNLVGAPIETGS